MLWIVCFRFKFWPKRVRLLIVVILQLNIPNFRTLSLLPSRNSIPLAVKGVQGITSVSRHCPRLFLILFHLIGSSIMNPFISVTSFLCADISSLLEFPSGARWYDSCIPCLYIACANCAKIAEQNVKRTFIGWVFPVCLVPFPLPIASLNDMLQIPVFKIKLNPCR